MMLYQIGFCGLVDGLADVLRARLLERVNQLGLAEETLAFLDEENFGARSRKHPFIAIFFGHPDASRLSFPNLDSVLSDSSVVIPCVENLHSVSDFLPECLRHINAYELRDVSHVERLASIVLENFRLLRAERRLFISYRRVEAQSIAIQLYEDLGAAGFDVFLDTRGVPPAADFQAVLWHRMADSDVVVLLDTPEFRVSDWTRAELAQANTTSVQILHVLWPNAEPDPTSALSEFFLLSSLDFQGLAQVGPAARLQPATLKLLTEKAEGLRARALAARHRYLVDNFCDQARSVGVDAIVQAERFITFSSGAGAVAVVPAIGVPSAAHYQKIQSAIDRSYPAAQRVWLLYDDRGILASWLDHMDWLNGHLPVSAVRVSDSSGLIAKASAQ